MNARIFALLLIGLIALPGLAIAADNTDNDCAAPTFMSRADIPGLGLAQVSRTGILVEVYGHAKAGQCVSEATIFEAASLTKPVVAYLVMRLVERETLDLDDALIDLLPSLPLPKNDPRSRKVTVRMALSHCSGLDGPDDQRLKFAEEPGSTFRYYPAGYRLVQRIVEHLETCSLEELAQREVFRPLGMTSSSLVYRPKIANRIATRHNILSEPIDKNRAPQQPANAAASLLTTPRDYGRFLQAMLQPIGLKQSSVLEMLTPQIDVADSNGQVAWGIGWGLEPKRGSFFHWGDDGAAKCFTIGSQASNTAIVYFTNSFYGMCIADEMAQRVIPQDSPAVKWLGYSKWDSPIRLARRDILRTFIDQGPQAGMKLFRECERRHADLNMNSLARWLAWLLDLRDLHEERIEILAWQLGQKPDNVDLKLSLAQSQQKLGNYASALATLQDARATADDSIHDYIDRQIKRLNGSLKTGPKP